MQQHDNPVIEAGHSLISYVIKIFLETNVQKNLKIKYLSQFKIHRPCKDEIKKKKKTDIET